MKSGTRASENDKQPNCPRITRREALFLFGGAAVSAALAGCGGGSSTSGAGPVALGGLDRTAIKGDLVAQLNQFSTIVQGTTDTWFGTSGAMDALRDLPGRSSRAPTDVKTVIQALAIGVNATRSAYERFCSLALMLDDLGAGAAAVTKNNTLSGSNAVNNEQWLAAMIAQNYAAISVTGTLFVVQQVAGLTEARAWALARTAESDRLAAYGLVADAFNTWVDALTAAGNITPQDTWKLDMTNAVSAANIGDKLGQIDSILPNLPFSPGYRKAGAALTQTDDESLGATGIQNFAQTFTGALARLTLSTAALTDSFPQTVDTTKAHYDVTARLSNTGLGRNIAALVGGLPAAQQTIDRLLSSTDGTSWPGATGDSAACQVQIVSKIYGFLQALTTALITTRSALGSLITGAQALQFLADLETTVATCGSAPQKRRWEVVKRDRDLLVSQQLLNGSVPTARLVVAVSIATLSELDQISKSGGISSYLEVGKSGDDANGNANGNLVSDVCVLDPTNPNVSDYRAIVSGIKKLPDCPRTFRNVLICIAGLFYDISKLYPETIVPKWESPTRLTFISTAFARVLRREPQATFAQIPAITSAQLLCSGVGYVPSRSLTPVDLSTIPKMPDLTAITNLVGGVPINVH